MRVAAALAQEEAARAQVALLQQRLRDKTATMLGGAAREAALKEQLADLQAMVEVSLGVEWIQLQVWDAGAGASAADSALSGIFLSMVSGIS
jgi:hypothetical protein